MKEGSGFRSQGSGITPERRWALSCVEKARGIESRLSELRLDERAWASDAAAFLRRMAQAWLDRAAAPETSAGVQIAVAASTLEEDEP